MARTLKHKTLFEDNIGKKFGRLVVLEEGEPKIDKHGKNQRTVVCKCDCGNTITKVYHSVKKGDTQSCGCLAKENGRKQLRKSLTKHGVSHTRLYNIYKSMKSRCYSLKHRGYHNYGGKGVTICSEWLTDINSFLDWAVKNNYSGDLEIDRIDADGNYEPSNCQFITREENIRKKESNKLSLDIAKEIRERYSMGESGCRLAEVFNCHTSTIYSVLNNITWVQHE